MGGKENKKKPDLRDSRPSPQMRAGGRVAGIASAGQQCLLGRRRGGRCATLSRTLVGFKPARMRCAFFSELPVLEHALGSTTTTTETATLELIGHGQPPFSNPTLRSDCSTHYMWVSGSIPGNTEQVSSRFGGVKDLAQTTFLRGRGSRLSPEYSLYNPFRLLHAANEGDRKEERMKIHRWRQCSGVFPYVNAIVPLQRYSLVRSFYSILKR